MELETLPQKKATEVGSYFVANYPPFSVWSPSHKQDVLAALDRPPRPGTPLGLYLHVPFCRKRCKFCYFRVYTDKNADEVETYLDALSKEIHLYADRQGFGGRQFEFVYFGGGTPSFLSNGQLLRLIERINEKWTWDAAREVTFECEPGTLKESKLQTIKQIGVTRLSLGVEHFDDEILSINGRAHKSPEIERAYRWARDVGFPQINIDLIAGMLGETNEKWKYAVDKALQLDPDSVTIYQMEVPFNSKIAKDALTHGGVSEIAGWETKRRWVDEAFRKFEAAGYVVSSGYTLVKPERHAGFVYRDSLWRGADLVGTGVASFGHFQGVHYQNVDTWEQYISKLDAGELPVNRALPVTDHQLLIREMILQLKTGKLDAAYFRTKFGREILAIFREAWDSLVADGFLRIEADEIRLTRGGLLRVDSLLPRFFEPQFRNIRYT
jgi:oxygen-independent coproporphyrinogen-3 oxidase